MKSDGFERALRVDRSVLFGFGAGGAQGEKWIISCGYIVIIV